MSILKEFIERVIPPNKGVNPTRLRVIVERGFLLEKEAQNVLSCTFQHLVNDSSFDDFLLLLPKSEQASFLSEILYHIYYLNIPTEITRSSEKLFFFLFKVYASIGKASVIRRIFKSLSPERQRNLLIYCYQRYEEGAFYIIQQAKSVAAPPLRKLLSLLARSFVLPHDCFREANPEHLLKQLHKGIKSRTEELQKSLPGVKRSTVKRFVDIFGFFGFQKTDSQTLQNHIEAINGGEKIYEEGLKLITFALPTEGKDLSRQPYLPSLVKALRPFKELKVPIIVIDQSEPALFKRNARFIKRLKAPILHLGREEILRIADKLQITPLIMTDANGRFGYGGARNAAYLIAPLLKHYSLDMLNKMPREALQREFQEIVLGETKGPTIIHMGDDDLYMSPSIIYSDALFAYNHQNEYFTRYSWVAGRKTTWMRVTLNLDFLLKRPEYYAFQHMWQNSPFKHGISGLLTKPKVCLNLPHGQEEFHFRTLLEYHEDFRVPYLHLPGYRFPKVKLPRNRYVGLAELLHKLYIDAIEKRLITDLLDPENLLGKCALPWNEIGMRNRKEFMPFQNLQAALEYITTAPVTKEMQSRFWKNVELLHGAFQEFDLRESKNRPYIKEISEIQRLFAALKNDTEVLKEALKQPVDSTSPLTHALNLLTEAVGEAGFQKSVKKLLGASCQ